MFRLRRRPADPGPPVLAACLACGRGLSPEARFCRCCGQAAGAPPSELVELPECPICYRRADPDGRYASAARSLARLNLAEHRIEHETFPVGDDDWLEGLRELDRIRVGRWTAPFGLVRRYLVTGVVDGGRLRRFEHDAIVTAMLQLRAGDLSHALGDQPGWAEARQAVTVLLERYHAGRRPDWGDRRPERLSGPVGR